MPLVSFVLALAAATAALPIDTEKMTDARAAMIQLIRKEIKTPTKKSAERLEKILSVMNNVPRQLFVPREQMANAYTLNALPIGYNQTISNAYIVARMTAELDLKPTDRVLEIGTGSGYQAAILSRLARSVYTIEIVPELAERAAAVLAEQSYDNVTVCAGDGYFGLPQQAPFDAIIVTAGASSIPPRLLAQLKRGGRLIMPVGNVWAREYLTLVKKDIHGNLRQKKLEWTLFVPLTGRGQTDFTNIGARQNSNSEAPAHLAKPSDTEPAHCPPGPDMAF